MEPKLTNIFHRTGDALIKAINGSGPRLIINQGGQGSSKTYSTLQVIYNFLKGYNETVKCTIASYAMPHLKLGALTDFDNILTSFGEDLGAVRRDPSHPTYQIGKSEVNSYGVEGNLSMAHGPRRKILFINECNRKISYEVFDQLFSRSEITFLDFNPDQEFWLHDKVLSNFPHVLIKSNFLDNPYLPENELRNILLKKDKPGFENWWKVYGEGELGKLEGAIFTNWTYGEFDKTLPYAFGLDFGFNDPDALVKIAINHKTKKMYWDEKIYKEGNSFDQLRLMIAQHCNRNDAITADCADARMINELRRYFNVSAVNKAKWTVAEALKMMQDYEHIITETSFNLGKEMNNYIWNDKKAGVPISDFNHLIDAGRYRFQESLRGGGHQRWSA
jgi:phage terminase large subunit